MTDAEAKWAAIAPDFAWDGSLRDICVLGIDRRAWKRFAELLVQLGSPFSFTGGWSGPGFPEDLDRLFVVDPDQELTTLTLDLDGITVNCHFVDETEIELDIDPREINDAARFASILHLMQRMADALDEDVFLTPENAYRTWIFRWRPGAATFDHLPGNGLVI